ncbi:MAG: C40 family peptidase [Nitrospirae bacterium]|nr:C40 family peptidase [Nitrospirota bacterium]
MNKTTKVFVGVALLFSVMLISPNAWADKTYKVRKGDSLYKISKKFRIGIDAVSSANGLVSDKLVPGTKLIIPSKASAKKEPAAVKTVSSGNTSSMNSEDAKAEPTTYKETQHSKLKGFLTFITQQTLGIPYRFGSNSFKGTDCSGYVQKVFSLIGISLPRSAREQFHLGEPVAKEDLSIGDLVFFRTYASFPSHVGIYLGNDLFIHASTLARKVTIDKLTMPYYVKRFIGAKRLPGLSEINPTDSRQPLETNIQ